MYRKIILILGILLIPLATSVFVAQALAATNPIDLGITTQYNHFIFGDATLFGGGTAAPVAYAGDVSLDNNDLGKLDGICDPNAIALTVGGSLFYTSTGIYDGSGLVSGTISSGGSTFNECGTTSVTSTATIDFDGAETAMQTKAAAFATTPATGNVDLKACGVKLTGYNGGLNIFTISGSDLANPNPGFPCLTILEASCGAINLINVSGTTIDTNKLSIVRTGGVEPSQIVFNFYEATTINLVGGQFNGTIFAPYAEVNMMASGPSQPVIHNGSIVAKSLTGSVVSVEHPFGAPPSKCTPPVHTYDFGDLPDQYSTTLLANGPRHILSGTLVLGTAVDPDTDGVPSPLADGDDLEQLNDDDGITTNPASWLEGFNPNGFGVTASEAGCLNGWIDWNEDGDFDEIDEKIFDNVQVSTGLNMLDFTAPAVTYQGLEKFARFRISPLDGNNACSVVINPTGEVLGGEVEDYRYENPDVTAVTLQDVEADAAALVTMTMLIAAVSILAALSVGVWRAKNKQLV
ncbi:MAG: collagen-binding domain-containing protein [Candidatus Promineifilaceae bacterium]